MAKRRRNGTTKRKRFKRRRRYRSRIPTTVLGKSVIPNRMLVRLKYQDTVSITPAAGSIAYHLFSGMSLFDPDYTGSGHQPHGFDQYMLLYNHYTVLGARITVQFMGGTESYICGIGMEAGTGTTSARQLRLERPRTIYKVVPSNTGGPGKSTVTYKFGAKKFFGTKAIVGEDTYKGNTGASPTEDAYFHVFAASSDGSNTIGSIKAVVSISYIAMLTEPKALTGS